jgi:hypothetical protein
MRVRHRHVADVPIRREHLEAEVAMAASLHDGLGTLQGHAGAVCEVAVERADQQEAEFGRVQLVEETPRRRTS